MPGNSFSRRNFLKASAVAASAPFLLPSTIWAAERSPGERITVGIIGTGMMGRNLMNQLLRKGGAQVVAVCDVDSTRRTHHQKLVNDHYAGVTGRENYEGCRSYSDFRDILGRGDIDAVVIATPDHWHAIMAIAAAQAGKDIYCDKPLCQSVNEARAIVRAVRANERIFQTGSQQRSRQHFRRACEIVRNGQLGEVRRISVALPPGVADWCDLPESTPPEGLDWDFWLGPAPDRGWNEILSPVGVHDHFPRWRNYREYGGGMITDWGAHHFDIVQWAMAEDESGPVEVVPPPEAEAESGAAFFYRDGTRVTHIEGNGVTFFGTEGELFINRQRMEVFPAELEQAPLPEEATRLYESDDHVGNWLDCIRSREKPICDVEVGARSVTVCHLMNMAYWYGQRMAWSPDANDFFAGTGHQDWLDVSYRDPWKLPEV